MSASLASPPQGGAEAAEARTRPPLLAFVTDSATESVLREALRAHLSDGAEFRRGDLGEAARYLAQNPSPHVLLVDASGTDNALTALEALSQLVEPDVRVIAIGDHENVALYRGLTRGLGVLEYLYKPLTVEMVSRLIGPLVARQVAAARMLHGGRVIVVTGVHGGVGSSTIAANLAWYLAEQARRPTLLLDGDLYGAAAAMLVGAKPSPGLRAALDDPDRVDDLFIDRTTQVVGERLAVLSGEGKLTEPPNVAPDAVARLVETLRGRFRFLVCDAAVPASPIGRALFDLAHQRVLVTEPLLSGARDLLRYLALLPPASANAAPTTLTVLNHAGRTGGLGLAQFTQAVGSRPDLVIAHYARDLDQAANLGEPAARAHKAFRRGIVELAGKAASVAAPRPSRFWRRR